MKAAGKPADAPTPESEDIAKLLRALNEDLKADPIDDVADLDEDEEEPQASRGLPLVKIAAALVAAIGIGFAVVMLDPTGSAPTEPSAANTSTIPPAPAITRAPAASQTQAAAPESMISRSPATPPPPVNAAPPPPPPVAAPLSPPPALRVPEPPALPPTAAAVPTRPVVAAKPPEAPPPAPPAPRAEAPKPAPTPAPIVAAAPPMAPPPKTAENGDLQAMLAPPKDARDLKRAPVKPTESKAADPAVTAVKPASVAPEAALSAGRYAVQVGSFSVVGNADGLVQKLQGSGFTAYTVDWTDSSGKAWRAVRVGGYADAAAAKRAAGELKAKMNLGTVVVTTR